MDNKISWRGDSALKDGSEAKLDLSKGMYDAGDHMKFGFPLAYTATVLSWSILEYGDQMKAVNQLEQAQDSLKWITDYLINAHPSENVLYIQVVQSCCILDVITLNLSDVLLFSKNFRKGCVHVSVHEISAWKYILRGLNVFCTTLH